MGVEGCTKCIKYLLFLFNFIFWLAGGVILGVALWLRHDSQTSTLLELKFEEAQPPSTFYIGIHILIAVGAVMMVVGFLGCYGAIQESQCLLGTFFACLVILFACEVAGGIWGFINKDTISKGVVQFYDMVYDNSMFAGPPLSLTQPDEKRKTADAVLKAFHETLDCCGKGGTPFTKLTSGITQILSAAGATDVCPKTAIGKDCQTRIEELFSSKIYLIGIAALLVAVIMIFEMIFSMVLCCGIRSSPVY